MSKFNCLWIYIDDTFRKQKCETLIMTFSDIQKVLSFPIDHSFLNAKKELLTYGYEVKKISLKNKQIIFQKSPSK